MVNFNLDTSEPDVPSALRHGNKVLPLGRYLRRLIRIQLGRDPATPKEVLLEKSKEMLALLVDEKGHISFHGASKIRSQAQAAASSLTSRARVFKKRGSI